MMGSFVGDLLDDGYRVRLFSSQTRSDALVEGDLLAHLGGRGYADRVELESALDQILDVHDLVQVISACDFVVAARYHSILLPVLLGIPVLGLAYDPKTFDLLEYVGRGAYCVDIAGLRVDYLVETWERLRRMHDAGDTCVSPARLDEAAREVELQFDRLFGGGKVSMVATEPPQVADVP